MSTRLVLVLLSLAAIGCHRENAANRSPPTAIPSPHEKAAPKQPPLGINLDGESVDPFTASDRKAIVLIFVSTDCPIVNRYAPDLRRIYEAYQDRSVAFWLVYADPSESPDKIRQHLVDYNLSLPALRDPEHRLVTFCEARRTPEAALFTPDRRRHYRGRIDDRFTDYGKSRQAASRHDLTDAIDAVLEGRPVAAPVVEAIGCDIPGVVP